MEVRAKLWHVRQKVHSPLQTTPKETQHLRIANGGTGGRRRQFATLVESMKTRRAKTHRSSSS